MLHRAWKYWLALLLGCLFVLPAWASKNEPEEDFDYDVVARHALHDANDGRVEVIEFFWYQCPHCNALTPLIEAWAQRRQGQVHFVRVPIALNAAYVAQDRLYYALEELGLVEKLHASIFQAIHEDGVKLKTSRQISEFLGEEGVPRAGFLRAMKSKQVRAKVALARDMASHYRVQEVPTLVVDGRYLTSSGHVGGSHQDALAVVDRLVDRVIAERQAARSLLR